MRGHRPLHTLASLQRGGASGIGHAAEHVQCDASTRYIQHVATACLDMAAQARGHASTCRQLGEQLTRAAAALKRFRLDMPARWRAAQTPEFLQLALSKRRGRRFLAGTTGGY
jgi:hypothetical protein